MLIVFQAMQLTTQPLHYAKFESSYLQRAKKNTRSPMRPGRGERAARLASRKGLQGIVQSVDVADKRERTLCECTIIKCYCDLRNNCTCGKCPFFASLFIG